MVSCENSSYRRKSAEQLAHQGSIRLIKPHFNFSSICLSLKLADHLFKPEKLVKREGNTASRIIVIMLS